MIAVFTVWGEPKGKMRPRFSRVSGRTYTPKDTLVYENAVMFAFRDQCPDWHVSYSPIRADIKIYYKIPKSTSKKKRFLMERDLIKPTKKPDIDNVMKSIFDSLNGIAYHDDAQIVVGTFEKFYAEEPRVEVRLEELESWE